MSKRELGQLNVGNETDGPRTKRRRETAGISSDVDVANTNAVVKNVERDEEDAVVDKQDVRELGLKLWQTVKDAVNKDGRVISLDFLRKPSKRLYPDYYQLIHEPIALEDIRKKVENGSYPTLEAVRQDFELCFNNAKQYNMKESDIWRDAKELLKLVNKTYQKLIPPEESGETADDEAKGKSKTPNLTRLIKSRLQKLVDKTDDSGRVLSIEFMELPSKKDWPIYYKTIKRPQCIENIFKHIKRKEYLTASDFAADVELVFVNAMAFNQEHTGIWEDAKTLRDYFRVLMSDMPAPYSLPEYGSEKPKIKIKPPPAHQPIAVSGVSAAQPSTTSPQTLRIPAIRQNKMSPASTPVAQMASLPVATATTTVTATTTPSISSTAASDTRPLQLPQAVTPQPISFTNGPSTHYPKASYTSSVPGPVAAARPTSTPNISTTPVTQTHSPSHSPAPPMRSKHQLQSLCLTIQPGGRHLMLDYRDGVKCWAMRLTPGEKEIQVSQVTFLGEEEEDSSGEEEEEPDLKQEEEEEEEPIEVEASVRNGRKRGKGKGRGRPKGTTKLALAAKMKAAAVKKKKQKTGPVQIKLNGTVTSKQDEDSGKWSVIPSVGSSVLEVGESGGLIWKVYIQRLAD